MTIETLFRQPLAVINLGLESFARSLEEEGIPVLQVDWRPPLVETPWSSAEQGRGEAISIERPAGGYIEAANREAFARIIRGRPVLVGISSAGEIIPGMERDMILHAGPPVTWETMCGPMRGAVIGGLIYEGLAANAGEAETLAASGAIRFEPCHEHSAVGPMSGVTTWSMPVWVVENQAFGNRAYCSLNEGLGKVLRYGAYSPEVIDRLRWMASELAPILGKTLARHGPLDLGKLLAQALQMGDEGHNRNRAGTSLLIRELVFDLVQLPIERERLASVLAFVNGNDHFFLNLSMAAAKATLDAAAGIEGSTVLVAMCRNGTEFGIRVSGLGNRWFTAPANYVQGLYLPGFQAKDAARDLGDSAITETAGWGGFAMAAAPAIVQFIGGSPEDALATTERMYDITVGESDQLRIPALDFRGTPTAIDLRKVVETGILPVINTGIAHKDAGIGQIGAGLVSPPGRCFEVAWQAFLGRYSN